MLSFKLKAQTVTGTMKSFTLEDYPIKVSNTTFALGKYPKSDLLLYNGVIRGVPKLDLYEGDIVKYRDDNWLVCYDKKFYAINSEYEKLPVTEIGTAVIGNYFDDGFPVTMSTRKKILFKYHGVIFRLEDILGFYDDKLIVRIFRNPISIPEIQQDAGLRVNGTRVFVGDEGYPMESFF